jgi:hypothetical protein
MPHGLDFIKFCLYIPMLGYREKLPLCIECNLYPNVERAMILARILALVPLLLATPAWADSYYRCEEPDGRIVFLQYPCNGNSKTTKVLQSLPPADVLGADQQANYEKQLLACWQLFGYGHIGCSDKANIVQEVEVRQQQQKREESRQQKAKEESDRLFEEQERRREYELAEQKRERELAEQQRNRDLAEQREYEAYQRRMMEEEEQNRLTQGVGGGSGKGEFILKGVRRVK